MILFYHLNNVMGYIQTELSNFTQQLVLILGLLKFRPASVSM
jgi:hypothetical protein